MIFPLEIFPVNGIVFLAVFTQSLSGFGSALVAMAMLPVVISLHAATLLVALVWLIVLGTRLIIV